MFYCSAVIYTIMIPDLKNSSNKFLGSSLSLLAHGRAGARATPSLAEHFAKRNTKFGGGGNYQNSASGFSLKKVRILFKTDSQLVKFWFPASLGASPLASANEFSSNFQQIRLWRRIFARPRFSAATGFRILLRKKRRQKRCCPCPSPPACPVVSFAVLLGCAGNDKKLPNFV